MLRMHIAFQCPGRTAWLSGGLDGTPIIRNLAISFHLLEITGFPKVIDIFSLMLHYLFQAKDTSKLITKSCVRPMCPKSSFSPATQSQQQNPRDT